MSLKHMDTKIAVRLRPIGTPRCKVHLGDQVQDFVLEKETTVYLTCRSDTSLSVEHYGKSDNDPTTAIIVEQIQFNEITDYKFVYQGIYHPCYPKHLMGNDTVIPHETYLAWNGVWQLEFTLPIYTWIHKTLDLGWIYD